MSAVWLFSKPEGTCFAFASNLCTLKNTMTFCFWDKSQMPKKFTSTSVGIKNLIYKCKQDQLLRCQHSYLVCRLGDCRLGDCRHLLPALHRCVCCLIRDWESCSRKKPPLALASFPVWMLKYSWWAWGYSSGNYLEGKWEVRRRMVHLVFCVLSSSVSLGKLRLPHSMRPEWGCQSQCALPATAPRGWVSGPDDFRHSTSCPWD